MPDFKIYPDVHWHIDFDGTLFYSHAALLEAYKNAISDHGGILTSNAKDSLIRGESFLRFLNLCSWDSEVPDFAHVRARKNELYLSKINLIQPNTQLIEMALGLLPHVSIVTSSNRVAVEGILSAFNLSEFFLNIVSSDDVSKTKPDPEPYLKSISNYPDSIHVAIEDSEFGIISAKEAGLLVLRTTDLFIELNSDK
jgi:beta-phosphoglucomutase-like phosphatase (HAD superfamily)